MIGLAYWTCNRADCILVITNVYPPLNSGPCCTWNNDFNIDAFTWKRNDQSLSNAITGDFLLYFELSRIDDLNNPVTSGSKIGTVCNVEPPPHIFRASERSLGAYSTRSPPCAIVKSSPWPIAIVSGTPCCWDTVMVVAPGIFIVSTVARPP